MNKHDVKNKAEIERPVFPFASDWYRCSDCTLQKITPRSRFVIDVLRQADVGFKGGVWALVYGGTVRAYKPSTDTLDKALAMPLPNYETDEPPEECLKFFKTSGPLGLDRMLAKSIHLDAEHIHWIVTLDPAANDLFGSEREIALADYWRFFHTSQQALKKKKRAKSLFGSTDYIPLTEGEYLGGYIEYWPLVYRELLRLQLTLDEWRESGYIGQLDKLFRESIDVGLNTDKSKVLYDRRFNSLFGALVGFSAEEILGGYRLGKCPKCDEYFWTKHPIQTYCTRGHQKYRAREKDKERRSTELEKNKRRLRAKLDRRFSAGLISLSKDDQLREEINKADETALDRFVEKHGKLFEDKRQGPKPMKEEG